MDKGNTRRYVILDRDGTIIVERNTLTDPELLELIPGTGQALKRLSGLGLGFIVVTNQSGIGRGALTSARLEQIHTKLRQVLKAEGVELAGIYVCPHTAEDGCECRKPLPTLLRKAAQELQFDLKACFVIGDKASDIELGQAVGATTVLVRTGYGVQMEVGGTARPDYVVADVQAAARIIEELLIRTGADLGRNSGGHPRPS